MNQSNISSSAILDENNDEITFHEEQIDELEGKKILTKTLSTIKRILYQLLNIQKRKVKV